MKKLLCFYVFIGAGVAQSAFSSPVPGLEPKQADLSQAYSSEQKKVNPPPQHSEQSYRQEGFLSQRLRKPFPKSLRPAQTLKREKEPKLKLFEFLNEQQFSFEWAYGFLQEKYAPPLLKQKITQDFKNDTFFYLNFHQNIIKFPYVLKWGLRGSAGIVRNEDHESLYFYPLSLALITSLQIFEYQAIRPFFEIGYSAWNVDFSDFSDFFPFYGGGALISFSLFKNSLRHTLPDEYGIKDIGIIAEWKSHISPRDPPEDKSLYFLHSLHVGVYLVF